MLRFRRQILPGYENALKEAFELARGEYIITMDADFSHQPAYLEDLWKNRNQAELVVASRYVEGGKADMPRLRKVLSVILNKVYTWTLSLPYRDISSGFRLYKKSVLEEIELHFTGFSMLQELLTKIHCGGYRVVEIPFSYHPREHGRSHVKLFKIAFSYLATLGSMWRLRNSVDSTDYDLRAYNSRILPQRYWQRKRYRIIMDMLDAGDGILDIGCGTSKIIHDLPRAVGLDINHNSLRYLAKSRNLLVEAGIKDLPFKNSAFDTIICSEVIEHIPAEEFRIEEVERVLCPGGVFILGTPDYSNSWWGLVEWVYKKIIPGGYADQHITHYTSKGLKDIFTARGWEIIDKKSVLGMEVVFKARKTRS